VALFSNKQWFWLWFKMYSFLSFFIIMAIWLLKGGIRIHKHYLRLNFFVCWKFSTHLQYLREKIRPQLMAIVTPTAMGLSKLFVSTLYRILEYLKVKYCTFKYKRSKIKFLSLHPLFLPTLFALFTFFYWITFNLLI
jgi:hypothetical protein